jgi:hypothetical protein
MRATVITHLIPDVYAWLQLSKSCISRTAIAFWAKWTTPQITQHLPQYLVSVVLSIPRRFYNSASRPHIWGRGYGAEVLVRCASLDLEVLKRARTRLAGSALRQINAKQHKRRPQKQIARRVLAEKGHREQNHHDRLEIAYRCDPRSAHIT